MYTIKIGANRGYTAAKYDGTNACEIINFIAEELRIMRIEHQIGGALKITYGSLAKEVAITIDCGEFLFMEHADITNATHMTVKSEANLKKLLGGYYTEKDIIIKKRCHRYCPYKTDGKHDECYGCEAEHEWGY